MNVGVFLTRFSSLFTPLQDIMNIEEKSLETRPREEVYFRK